MKWRDFCVNIYLKILLEKYYNTEVFLSRLGEEKVKTHFYKPDLVILNNLLSQEKVDFSYFLKKKGIKIVVLPTEGVPFTQYLDVAAGRFVDHSAVDLYLSWNHLVKNRMIELATLPEKKIKVIGVPRFDFYFKPLNKLAPTKLEIQKKYQLTQDSKAPIVLYAANFPALCYQNNIDALYKEFDKYNVTKLENQSKNDLKKMLEVEFYVRQKALEVVEKLLNDFPNLQIIYKAHPAEDHQFYENYIRKISKKYSGRFAFVVKEYIWTLIPICNLIIQRSCTTGNEAWILNKPSLQTLFHVQDFLTAEEYEKGSDVVRSYHDCKKYVEYYLNGGTINKEKLEYRKKLLDSWYDTLDGQRTIEATHIIGNFIEASPQSRYPLHLKEDINLILKEYPKHMLRVMRNSYLLKTSTYDRFSRLDKIYSRKDIKIWEKKINSVLDSGSPRN